MTGVILLQQLLMPCKGLRVARKNCDWFTIGDLQLGAAECTRVFVEHTDSHWGAHFIASQVRYYSGGIMIAQSGRPLFRMYKPVQN